MRLFIAIDLPETIKLTLEKLISKLNESEADVKWVETKNIHLTLKFLGEVDEEKVEKIKQIVSSVSSKNSDYTIKISSLGAFPRVSFPRVIWVGLESGEKETKVIFKELEEKIQKLGIPKEKRAFSAHITIGRVRTPKNKEKLVKSLEDNIAALEDKNLEFKATKITLFQSQLSPKGPTYIPLIEAPLKQEN